MSVRIASSSDWSVTTPSPSAVRRSATTPVVLRPQTRRLLTLRSSKSLLQSGTVRAPGRGYDREMATQNSAEGNAPDGPSPDGRDETQAARLDRNWNEILQELRVIQTGTQILTGFLLTVAFQQRFSQLDGYQVFAYLSLVVLAALTTALGLTPVSLHRTLFHMKAKARIVRIANGILKITLVAVAVVLAGTVLLIFDVVVGRVAGVVAGASTLLIMLATWLLLPVGLHRTHARDWSLSGNDRRVEG